MVLRNVQELSKIIPCFLEDLPELFIVGVDVEKRFFFR